MKLRQILCVACLPLAACTAQGAGTFLNASSLLENAATGALSGIAPAISAEQILQSHINSHNLKIGLEQIDQSPGMVSMTTAPPVVGTPMTPPAVVPAPAPVPTPTVVPMPAPGGGPTIVTPTPLPLR